MIVLVLCLLEFGAAPQSDNFDEHLACAKLHHGIGNALLPAGDHGAAFMQIGEARCR